MPIEDRPAATSVPAEAPERRAAPRPPRREPAAEPSGATRTASTFATRASAAGARAAGWAATAAGRTRAGIGAAATSPRTRQAGSTAADYGRRAAAAVADAATRASEYAREQYERDPRRTLIVAGIAALAAVVLLVIVVSSFGGGGGAGEDTPGETGQPAIGTPLPTGTNGTPAAGTRTPTQTAAAAASLPGTPYSEAAILAALQSRGLNATLTNEPYACDNPGTPPKTYRVASGAGEQRVVLFVYPDAAAFGRDWVTGGGRPQYRNGTCAAGAAVVYFNVNAMMIFQQTTNAGVQAQISDAFLTLP